MGLLYPLPSTLAEADRVQQTQNSVILKSYGLPWIFWAYFAAIMGVLIFMILAMKNPIEKMLNSDDVINQWIAWAATIAVILVPLALLAMLFFEKQIEKSGQKLIVRAKLFGLTCFKRTFLLKPSDSFVIKHHLDSPNMARKLGKTDMRAFYNQGYFELFITAHNDKRYLIDRHSQKMQLTQISELLGRF